MSTHLAIQGITGASVRWHPNRPMVLLDVTHADGNDADQVPVTLYFDDAQAASRWLAEAREGFDAILAQPTPRLACVGSELRDQREVGG